MMGQCGICNSTFEYPSSSINVTCPSCGAVLSNPESVREYTPRLVNDFMQVPGVLDARRERDTIIVTTSERGVVVPPSKDGTPVLIEVKEARQ